MGIPLASFCIAAPSAADTSDSWTAVAAEAADEADLATDLWPLDPDSAVKFGEPTGVDVG